MSGGSDRLKCCEKHCPSKVAFSKFEFALVPFLSSVGMDDVSRFRHLMAFQKSLELGFSLWKKSFLASLSFVTTWFLNFLYFTASLLEDLARLKCRFRFLIIFVRSLVSQGRFFLLEILPLGMHFSIVSRNTS